MTLQKADIAVADLTITYERESAVDFTMPFMSLGIGILYKKPKKDPPKLFSFMSPLAVEVWVYLITSFLGVTLFCKLLLSFITTDILFAFAALSENLLALV